MSDKKPYIDEFRVFNLLSIMTYKSSIMLNFNGLTVAPRSIQSLESFAAIAVNMTNYHLNHEKNATIYRYIGKYSLISC